MCLSSRSYYESNDLSSALGVVEEALERHPSLVSDDFINMAAELYLANRQYNKALQVPLNVFVHRVQNQNEQKVNSVFMNVHTGSFSQVLVQFAGIVLIKDESNSDVTATSGEEKVPETTSEEQQSKEDSTRTGAAKETTGEDCE